MIISSPKDIIILIYNIYLKSNLINQWGTITSSVFTYPISLSGCYIVLGISSTTSSTWGRPVLPHNPTITKTKTTFKGMISGQEQANSWTTTGFSGRGFIIGK